MSKKAKSKTPDTNSTKNSCKSSKNSKKAKSLSNAQNFDDYYSSLYGTRWDSLKTSLLQESETIEYTVDKNCRTYYLDRASITAASVLPLKGAKNILDLCAAPGGKSLVLSSLMDEDATLDTNERSFDRKMRLTKVLDEHLPEATRSRVNVFCSDGATWCKNKTSCYDRILLDVPCSSERHVINDKKYLDLWTLSRVKTISMQQWALLSCAYRLLKNNCILVYSTCSLAKKENDDVISQLLKKFPSAKVLTLESPDYQKLALPKDELLAHLQKFSPNYKIPGFEKTQFGYHILPDAQEGTGPIYFCIVMKCEDSEE